MVCGPPASDSPAPPQPLTWNRNLHFNWLPRSSHSQPGDLQIGGVERWGGGTHEGDRENVELSSVFLTQAPQRDLPSWEAPCHYAHLLLQHLEYGGCTSHESCLADDQNGPICSVAKLCPVATKVSLCRALAAPWESDFLRKCKTVACLLWGWRVCEGPSLWLLPEM